MLTCIFFAPLILGAAEPSTPPPVVRPIGFHQYRVTGAGKQMYAKAGETCVKLGRTSIPLPEPPEETSGKQFRFECILPYEIVPSGQGTYTIHVPTEKMLAPVERMCPPSTCPIKNLRAKQLPDIETASKRTEQLARTYCAKTQKTMMVTSGGFDAGPGFTLVFKCVTPQQGAPSR